MKIKSILATMLLIVALASCSDNNGVLTPTDGKDFETAYLSLQITYPTTTRGSEEENAATADESTINTFYIITFDTERKLVHHSKENPVITTATSGLSDPIRVSPSTQYLLVVANPGPLLKNRLNALTAGALYTDFNKAITVSIASGESGANLVNEIWIINDYVAKNFAMINAGSYDTESGKWDPDCLLDVSTHIKTESSEANGNPASLNIERLAAKVTVTAASGEDIAILPSGAQFSLTNWALDYRNSIFFPFATKTNITASHTGSYYDNNFYTEDPNFTGDDLMIGVIPNEVINREPKVNWINPSASDYCIENTMAAADQKYGAATRVVLKARYAPATDGYTLGDDWFSFGSDTYASLSVLQNAYTTAMSTDPSSALIAACDNFLVAVKAANSGATGVTVFTDLTTTHLSAITDGGEITKQSDCIRWYQNSVNYYYYEIRHDNSSDAGIMAYGKYGVVRNNYYALRLTKVNGKGTPWYPGGGPGEPDPEDPIDEVAAYLMFDIKVTPWVYWNTDFEI